MYLLCKMHSKILGNIPCHRGHSICYKHSRSDSYHYNYEVRQFQKGAIIINYDEYSLIFVMFLSFCVKDYSLTSKSYVLNRFTFVSWHWIQGMCMRSVLFSISERNKVYIRKSRQFIFIMSLACLLYIVLHMNEFEYSLRETVCAKFVKVKLHEEQYRSWNLMYAFSTGYFNYFSRITIT